MEYVFFLLSNTPLLKPLPRSEGKDIVEEGAFGLNICL